MDLKDIEKAAADLRKLVDEQSRLQSKLQGSIDIFVQRYREWSLQESAAQLACDFDLVRKINNDETAIFLEYVATLKSKQAQADFVSALSRRMNWRNLSAQKSASYVRATSIFNASPQYIPMVK